MIVFCRGARKCWISIFGLLFKVANVIRCIMKSAITNGISLILSYFMDIMRFIRSSQLRSPMKNQLTAQSHMLRIAHALEKGMALPSPRAGYGNSKMVELLEFVDFYCISYEVDFTSRVAVSSVESLLKYHCQSGHKCTEIEVMVDVLLDKHPKLKLESQNIDTGIKEVLKSDVLSALPKSPEDFFRMRSSVRQFKQKEINLETIERILTLANKTPSVCNRQSARVYVYNNADSMAKILMHQDGNSGFGSSAGAVLMVTSDLSCFYKSGERNQSFVDGGLFSMSLVYAAHSIGIGSCMLNWSQGARSDKALRLEFGIPDNEVVIMMIAIGHLLDNYDVAVSPRLSVQQIAKFN